MSPFILIAALALVGCGGPPDCVLDSGLKVYETRDCEALNTYSATVITSFERFFGRGFDGELSKWSLYVHRLNGPRGLTHPYNSTIEIVPDAEWRETSFAHELVHVLEARIFKREGVQWGCTDVEIKYTDEDHCSWLRRRVWDEIELVKGER
jgi:hypothetical protein